MKNKNLFLLPLFLLFPAATQCMEQISIIKPRTMQDIRNDRDEIYQERLNTSAYAVYPLDTILFQGHWANQLAILKKEQQQDCLNTEIYTQCIMPQGHSLLGLATITIKSESFSDKDIKARGQRKKELLAKEKPEQVSFKEKKEHIQQLCLLFKFEPKEKDKELALLEQWERWQPIIKNICHLRCAYKDHINLISEIPYDVVKYIEELMLISEKPLF